MAGKNYFAGDAQAAERYARSRPYFHPAVIARLRAVLGDEAIRLAIDAGCGTGQSSIALAEIAARVIGVDASPEMLAAATARRAIAYRLGHAENLPIADGEADLITAGLALHWFNRMEFLREAARALRPGGWLASYGDHFSDKTADGRKLKLWEPPGYASQFPPVGKDRSPITAEQAIQAGLQFIREETIEYQLTFDLESFIQYFTTQSNILAAIQSGSHSLADVEEGVRRQLAPHFAGEALTLLFTATITTLRKPT